MKYLSKTLMITCFLSTSITAIAGDCGHIDEGIKALATLPVACSVGLLAGVLTSQNPQNFTRNAGCALAVGAINGKAVDRLFPQVKDSGIQGSTIVTAASFGLGFVLSSALNMITMPNQTN